MARLAGALEDGQIQDTTDAVVQLVFISVDPDRDSISDIARYTQHFDDAILGVTGNVAQLEKLADDLGIQFEISVSEASYKVAHSLTYSIVDIDGKLRGRFRPGFNVAELVEDLKLL